MRKMTPIITGLFILMGISQSLAQDAKEIVRKADDKFNGEKSSISEMEMTIVRPSWQRTVEFKNWTRGNAFALTLITAPAREKGQTFLKRENEMWHWMPSINRLIKLPPSMMSEGWMGSDYTNDDILKESSIVEDYEHKIIGEENIDSHPCYKIELTPKPEAAVVWGKIIKWISKEGYMQMKSEYYDEDDYLIKTDLGSDVKVMDGRELPTRMEIIPADEENKKTIVILKEITFNEEIPDGFFSQQNMKRIH
jgi:outer membrane lipoprotein-sorting protein